MACSPSFVEHALDLLSLSGPVVARRMFGGHGLYLGGVMFGLLDDDELFLKTDAETRGRFLEAGCRMWVYPSLGETSYYRPPDDAHEDPEAMLPWARLAVDAARRKHEAKLAEAAARAARPAARAPRAPAPGPERRGAKAGKAPPPARRAAAGKVGGGAPVAPRAAGKRRAASRADRGGRRSR
jgi:DNA transformation protein and related proteins